MSSCPFPSRLAGGGRPGGHPRGSRALGMRHARPLPTLRKILLARFFVSPRDQNPCPRQLCLCAACPCHRVCSWQQLQLRRAPATLLLSWCCCTPCGTNSARAHPGFGSWPRSKTKIGTHLQLENRLGFGIARRAPACDHNAIVVSDHTAIGIRLVDVRRLTSGLPDQPLLTETTETNHCY